MPTVQAAVPQTSLATAVAVPNRLSVDYSSEVLLPLGGPILTVYVRRDFVRGLMAMNEYLEFCELAVDYLARGGKFPLEYGGGRFVPRGPRERRGYDRTIGWAARRALAEIRSADSAPERNSAKLAARTTAKPTAELVRMLELLASPSEVYRAAFDAGLLEATPRVLGKKLIAAKGFDARCAATLDALVGGAGKRASPPKPLADLAAAALSESLRYRGFLADEFGGLTQTTRARLATWMREFHLAKPPVAKPFVEAAKAEFGFAPIVPVTEWALSRIERLDMDFGKPDLRGPLAAESLPPEGTYRYEEYRAMQSEVTVLASETARSATREGWSLETGRLRSSLDHVYYSGPGDVSSLASQASESLLQGQKRNVVLSLIREASEEREKATGAATRQTSSTTITRESRGVDNKLAVTHHRFKVVVPITANVRVQDVGLTWCPWLVNPFIAFRKAVERAYRAAYIEHVRQYYVPEPVSPAIVWETYSVGTSVYMSSGGDEEAAEEHFTILLPQTDRQDKPDFNAATVVWNQNESWCNDDPDNWQIWLKDLAYSQSRITGNVRVETADGGADFDGTAEITIPVLRYSQETVNALAQHQAEMQDHALKIQALEAQARQYARIKAREFIERHAAADSILKILMEALMARVTMWTQVRNRDYYREIVSRCVDWSRAKFEMQSGRLASLPYPEFPPDHFVNANSVRLFLPIVKTAETVFFDALAACGTFATRTSVESVQEKIDAYRAKLIASGPSTIDSYTAELVVGEHIEGVLSTYDLKT